MIKKFALIFGIIYLLVGIVGFIPGMSSHPADMDAMHPVSVEAAHGYLMGLFPVNAMHNIVHILIGLWVILSSRNVGSARTFGKGLAILYGLLTIMGLIPGLNTMFGLAPLHGHDVWLHALSALVAAYFGFVARDSDGAPQRA